MRHDRDLCLDAFLAWLSLHERDYVGSPGMCFSCPLAVYLSECDGRLYGVDGDLYGPALIDSRSWQYLPLWARRFIRWSECYAFTQLTGREVFHILATIEQYYGQQNGSIIPSYR